MALALQSKRMNETKTLFGGFPGARFIGKEEQEEILSVLDAQSPYRFYGLNLLKKAEKLEALSRSLFQRSYALAVSSGTAALHTALFSLGVNKGDEVILPAYAWSADLMAILALGAIPVIASIDETLGLDSSSLASCISRKTKVIIAVHMRGYPCNLERIVNFCKAQRIFVLEDGAQCLDGKIDGKPVGSMGDVSILSFQYHKFATSGEGGMLLTNDPKLYERACRFHDLGMFRKAGDPDPEGSMAIQSLGLNYRISELQAAFLLAQLERMSVVRKSLTRTRERARKVLEPFCREFGLKERLLSPRAEPNGAFLCLTAPNKRKMDEAWNELREKDVTVGRCSQQDPHHFMVWKKFMDHSGLEYRCVATNRSVKFLERNLFFELNPLPASKGERK